MYSSLVLLKFLTFVYFKLARINKKKLIFFSFSALGPILLLGHSAQFRMLNYEWLNYILRLQNNIKTVVIQDFQNAKTVAFGTKIKNQSLLNQNENPVILVSKRKISFLYQNLKK